VTRNLRAGSPLESSLGPSPLSGYIALLFVYNIMSDLDPSRPRDHEPRASDSAVEGNFVSAALDHAEEILEAVIEERLDWSRLSSLGTDLVLLCWWREQVLKKLATSRGHLRLVDERPLPRTPERRPPAAPPLPPAG